MTGKRLNTLTESTSINDDDILVIQTGTEDAKRTKASTLKTYMGLDSKATKPGSSSENNLASFDSTNDIKDSGVPVSSVVTQSSLVDNASSTSTTAAPTANALKGVSDVKADKTNVLEKDNTTSFTPSADYHPATKKFVDDSVSASGVTSDSTHTFTNKTIDCDLNTVTDIRDANINPSAGIDPAKIGNADVGVSEFSTLSDIDTSSTIQSQLDGKSSTSHIHDDRYYTETEIDTQLGLKSDKTNVLEKDNTTSFTPSADYHPATKKFVDDSIVAGSITPDSTTTFTNKTMDGDDNTFQDIPISSLKTTDLNGAFNKNFGSTSGSVCQGNDARLSDSRQCNNSFDNALTARSNLGLSDENIQDKVGAMLSGNTETRITATYQDSDGTIDFEVDNDLANYDNTNSEFATKTGTETLTNKTLTAPTISSITNIGTLTLPTSTDTLIGRDTVDELTNKELTSPDVNGGTVDSITSLTVANDVDLGDFNVKSKSFESDASTGTAPLVVASTTVVSNFNADKLDGADLVDEDDMASDSAVKVPTQQSVKAYVDSQVQNSDTLSELNDTNITSPGDGSVLFYDSDTGKWIDNVVSGDVTIADTGVATISSEKVQDTAGAMFTGNTETRITATYQDSDGTIDLEVDNDLANYDNTNSGFATKTGTETLTNKTINVDDNTVSNIEVGNFKSGVLDTDLSSVSGSDDTIPSAKATKAYVDAQIQTKDTLSELTDVTVSSVGDNELLAYDNTSSSWINQTPSEAGVPTLTGTETLTNKTINVDDNTVSNIEVDNLKSGVLDTDLSSVSGSDDTIPSAKATKAQLDLKADASLASVSEASSPTQITTSDTVLTAFGKIMKYITDFLSAFNGANQLLKLDPNGDIPSSLLASSSGSTVTQYFGGLTTTSTVYTDDYITLNWDGGNKIMRLKESSGSSNWGFYATRFYQSGNTRSSIMYTGKAYEAIGTSYKYFRNVDFSSSASASSNNNSLTGAYRTWECFLYSVSYLYELRIVAHVTSNSQLAITVEKVS